MPLTAIVTDTNSGIMPDQNTYEGLFVLPMPFNIDGRNYLDGVDLTQEQFFEFQEAGADIHTSQPSASDVMGLWAKVLKDYDELVYIPMSSGLSGSYQSARLYAEDFDGRVHVVNNQRISVTLRQSCMDALALAGSGRDGNSIRQILEDTKFDSSIYIMLDTLYYLKKGGRITPAAAAFASILNLKPILQIQGEKLDSFSKCRSIKQGRRIMINSIRKDVDERFGGFSETEPTVWIQSAYTKNLDVEMDFLSEIREHFPGHSIHFDPLPPVIACHIGPGALALACTRILPGGQSYPPPEERNLDLNI